MSPDVDAVVELGFGVDLWRTLSPLRRGPGDPTMRRDGDLVWRTSRMSTGTVTYALRQLDPRRVRVRAWGDGAAELLEGVPDLLGARDDPGGFDPQHPLLADAHRRFPGLRVPATHRVMEALVPAIIEQKVVGLDAFASFRRLVTRLGDDPPGPAPDGMRVFPTAETWAAIPTWEWHRAGVGPERARTLQAAARLAPSIERLGTDDPARLYAGLRSIRGIGVWTVAEVGQRALGDPDAVSIGDYHLPAVVGVPLTGRPLPEDEVEEFLEPWRPQRWRVFRLLGLSPHALAPRRGPRMSRIDYRAL